MTLSIFAVLLALASIFFPDEARKIVFAIADAVTAFIAAATSLLAAAIRAIWTFVKPQPADPVKPHQAVDPVRSVIGALILIFAGGVIVANFGVLAPTLEIIVPSGDLCDYLAAAIVGLGCAVGILLHAAPQGRIAYLFAASAITGVVTVLAYIQTLAVAEGDVPLAVLRALIALTLQVVEILAFKGGVSLAGHILPPVLASPALLVLGAVWSVFRCLELVKIESALARAFAAATAAGERGLAWVSRRLLAQTSAARAERRFAAQKAEFERSLELASRKQQLDDAATVESARCRRVVEDEQLQRDHDRALRAAERQLELEYLPRVRRKVFELGEENTLDVANATSPELKKKAIAKIDEHSDSAAGGMAGAILSMYRHVGYFRPDGRDKTNSHEPEKKNTTVN